MGLLQGLHRRVLALERRIGGVISGTVPVGGGGGGSAITALTGEVTATGPGSVAATIANDAVTTVKIAADAVTYAKIQNVSATDRLLGRDTAGAGDIEELTVGGGVEFTGAGGIQRSALTGDVTASAGSAATTVANDAVTNAKLANMSDATLKGRALGAGTGDPTDLTPDQATSLLATASSPFLQFASIPGGSDAFWDGSIRRNADSAGRNSSNTGTTLTDDGVLQFDMVAGGAYFFEMWLCYSSPAGGGTPDFKFKLTGPATLTGQYTDIFYIGTTDANGTLGINTVGATGAIGTATVPRLYRCSGWCHSTGGGTGASGFRLQWAQNTSNANDVILHSGSLLQYRRAA